MGILRGHREWYGFCEWGLGHMTKDDDYRALGGSQDVSREDIFCACQPSGVECGCRGHHPRPLFASIVRCAR